MNKWKGRGANERSLGSMPFLIRWLLAYLYKSVIDKLVNINKNVRECFHGVTGSIETAGLEKFALSQAADLKRRASGGQDMGFQGIWQTLL